MKELTGFGASDVSDVIVAFARVTGREIGRHVFLRVCLAAPLRTAKRCAKKRRLSLLAGDNGLIKHCDFLDVFRRFKPPALGPEDEQKRKALVKSLHGVYGTYSGPSALRISGGHVPSLPHDSTW